MANTTDQVDAIKSPCEICQSLMVKAIGQLPADLSCAVIGAAFGSICAVVTAETVIGPVVCAVAAVILSHECEKHGMPWIKKHKKTIAHQICVQAWICWSLTEEEMKQRGLEPNLGIHELTEEEIAEIKGRLGGQLAGA